MTLHDDYLWDGSGEPDPLIAELERDLAPLRLRPAPAPERLAPERLAPPAPRPARLGWAVAAMIAMGVLAVWASRPPAPAAPGWTVAAEGGRKLPRPDGARVEAGAGQRPTVRWSAGPAVTLEPGAVVLLGGAGGPGLAVTLERGKIAAEAPASGPALEIGTRLGAVKLPAGAAGTVELERTDCTLTLERGQARVLAGDSSARLLAGMECTFREGEAGLPVRAAAGEDLRSAVAMMQHRKARGKAIYAVVELAKREDAATLWNAAASLEPEEAQLALKRLAELVPPPGQWAAEKVKGMHPVLMDQWWDAIAGSPPR